MSSTSSASTSSSRSTLSSDSRAFSQLVTFIDECETLDASCLARTNKLTRSLDRIDEVYRDLDHTEKTLRRLDKQCLLGQSSLLVLCFVFRDGRPPLSPARPLTIHCSVMTAAGEGNRLCAEYQVKKEALASLTQAFETLEGDSQKRGQLKRELHAGRAILKRAELDVKASANNCMRLYAQTQAQQGRQIILEDEIKQLKKALKNVPNELKALEDQYMAMIDRLLGLVLEVVVEWDQQRKRERWTGECERQARLAAGV